MLTAKQIKQARHLMADAFEKFGNKDLLTAERSALTFLDDGFDHFKIRRLLALVLERKGHFSQAEVHLVRALRYQPGDRDS
jgi:hypothetical protein